MPARRLVLMSSSLLGVFTFALYISREMAAAVVMQSSFPMHDPNLWPEASWYVLGPWLPASYRIAPCLAVGVALGVAAFSRVLRHSRDALLDLHASLWMLAVISLPMLLWARDLATIHISQCMEELTPELERQMHAAQVYEASWFWVLVALATIALYGCLRPLKAQRKHPST